MIYIEKKTYHRIIEQFLVTKFEAVLLLISGILLVVYTLVYLANGSESIETLKLFGSDFLRYPLQIVAYFAGTVAGANVATMLLWSVVGSLVYVAAWALYSTYSGASSTYNFFFKYIHPDNFNTAQYIAVAMFERLISVVEVFVLVFYSSFFVRVGLPFVFEQSAKLIQGLNVKSLAIFGYMIVLVSLVHVLFVILRLVRGTYMHEEYVNYGGRR